MRPSNKSTGSAIRNSSSGVGEQSDNIKFEQHKDLEYLDTCVYALRSSKGLKKIKNRQQTNTIHENLNLLNKQTIPGENDSSFDSEREIGNTYES